MKINSCFVLLILVSLFWGKLAFAQKESANWYFGEKEGIHFNPAPTNLPIPLSNSKMKALEGCAAISDSAGNLLFYTAGDTVYNSQHKKMSNGWLLSGHQSATQSSLMIKQPGSSRMYYLFTVDAVGGPGGLKYSVIDAKALNGDGKVLAKNVNLVSPVAEKITAVDHRTTKDVWVITHGFGPQNGNKFYAYRVSANGVANPVISTIGTMHGPLPTDAVGALKASPDGSKLALAMESRGLVELFDFNDETGAITNSRVLSSLQWAYGVEFSPDGSKLFVSNSQTLSSITSFNVTAARFDRDSIKQTQQNIGVSVAQEAGSLQLGPNYVVYVALPNKTSLGTISFPNSPVFQAVYRDQGLSLIAAGSGKVSRQGLPAFNQSFFYRPHFITRTVCIGDVSAFKIAGTKQFKSVHWSFRDPDSGKDSASVLFSPNHIFTKPGTYNVTLTVVLLNDKVYSNTISVEVVALPKFSLGPDLQVCPNDSVLIRGPKKTTGYNWSTGEKTDSIYAKKPGRYYLQLKNLTGCMYEDTIDVFLKPGPVMFKQKYYEMCLRRSVKIYHDYRGGAWRWDDGSTDTIRTVTKAGWYKGYASYNGCTFTDSVEVAYKECLDDLDIPNIITPNGDELNDTFTLMGLKPGDWHIQIYNRWGVLIYEDRNYRNDWPKKLPSAGTYYYLLRKAGIPQTYKGWLEVVR